MPFIALNEFGRDAPLLKKRDQFVAERIHTDS